MNIKKWLTGFLLLLFFFSLQTVVFRYVPFGRSLPNLLLILTCVYGLMRGEQDGIITGFFCGLLLDIFFLDILGFYAMLYAYIGFFNGLAHKLYNKDDYKIPLLALIVSDITFLLLKYFFAYALQGDFNFGFYLKGIFLPELVFTLVCGVVIYPLLLLLEEKFINYVPEKKTKESEEII